MPHDDTEQAEDFARYRLLYEDNQQTNRNDIQDLQRRVSDIERAYLPRMELDERFERITDRLRNLELQFAKTATVYGLAAGALTTIIGELIKHAIK